MPQLNRVAFAGVGGAPPTRTSRRGSVLVGALIVVFVLGGLMMGLLQIGTAFTREQKNQEGTETATQICEAALSEAIFALRAGGSGIVGTQADPARFGDGLFWTTIDRVANDLSQITAAAMVGSNRTCIVQLVFHYNEHLFDTTIFGNQPVVIPANVEIDSFDSADGSYADLLALSATGYVSDGATIQSNGDIDIGSSTEIHGDAHPGEESDLTAASNAVLTGSSEPLAETRVLPPVTVPPIPIGGALNVLAAGSVLPPGDYGFTELTTAAGTDLTITGPARIVVDDFVDIVSNSDLVIDSAAGDVEIYVLGDLEFQSNSSVTTTDLAATSLSLFLAGPAGQTATFNSNGAFYGAIYGPNATVDVQSNFVLHGALAAEEVLLSSNVQIHYDEALRNDGITDRFVGGHMVRGAFPDPTLVTRRGDPFRLLGVQRHALRLPADAHEPAP